MPAKFTQGDASEREESGKKREEATVMSRDRVGVEASGCVTFKTKTGADGAGYRLPTTLKTTKTLFL